MHFVLADQSLVNYMGHSFEYARSIRNTAQNLGHKVTVLANRSVSQQVIENINAIPCFRYALDHSFDSTLFRTLPHDLARTLFTEWNYVRHTHALNADLRAIEQQIHIDTDTLFIFHTIRHNHILPLVKWVEHLPKHQRPWFILVLHFTAYPNYAHTSETAKFYRRAFSYLENSCVRERFRLFTDSSELADEYRNYTNLSVGVLPIPHTTPPEIGYNTYEHQDSSDAIRLTYMGDARTNKGFHLLPDVFRKLSSEFECGNLEAELQANIRTQSEWEVGLAVRRLRQHKGVKLYETNLSSEDYYHLLYKAGIILLPYTLDHYHSQTSGIFCEALAYGKPVVVPRGTWMAKQMKAHGAGFTFLPSDQRSLYESVSAAVHHYDNLKSVALERSQLWRQMHCPLAYISAVMNSLLEE